MTTQTIEVEGLPEGCEAVAVQFEPNYFNKYTGDDGYIYFEAKVKVKKIQPRRIVLDHEIWEALRKIRMYYDEDGELQLEVKETDIPLTNSEPKLSLSVDDCKTITGTRSHDLACRIERFIKDK